MSDTKQRWIAVLRIEDNGESDVKSSDFFHEDELRGILESVDFKVAGLAIDIVGLLRTE